MDYHFDALRVKNAIVAWIRNWFEENGRDCNAVIGISGGKDSSVVAALCVEALGEDRVIGVLMPNLTQDDIEDSYELVNHLNIQSFTLPITMPVAHILHELSNAGIAATAQTTINLPARIRMATLYAVSQSMHGRVANTCNLSEEWVGYSTRYGDGCTGDFCPLLKLTATEVKQIGHLLGLPPHLVEKTPSDGLSGKTDEDNFGFTYAELDRYIRTEQCESAAVKKKINSMHEASRFKRVMPPAYYPRVAVEADVWF